MGTFNSGAVRVVGKYVFSGHKRKLKGTMGLGFSSLVAILMLSALFVRVPSVRATTPPDEWPMFHHDLNHTGYSTSTAPNTNQIAWSYTTWDGVWSSPAVAGGMVYVGSIDHKVYCLDAATGAFVWSYTTPHIVWSSPAVAGGMVYVGSGNGKVYCLDAATGAFVWSYTTGNGVVSSPAVAGGMVYVGSFDGKVYCLDAATGAFVWSYTTGNVVQSSPAVAGGMVYVGSNDGKVYCLDAATGAFVWSYTTGNIAWSSPAVAGGMVYVGSGNGKVYCLDAASGTFIWSYTTGSFVYSSPAVADGKVYVGSSDHKVYCLDAATGAFVWSYTTGNGVDSSPAVAGGMVYVGSYDGKVYCLDAATGAFVWSYTTGTSVGSSPAVAGGMVYVGSYDGKVYCFWSDTTPPSVIVNSPMNITYATSSIPVNATAIDASGVSTVLAEIDGSNNVTLVLQGGFYVNNTVSFTPDGSHQVRIYANDTWGNTNSSQIVHFAVDTTPPYLISYSPTNHTFQMTNSVDINFRVNDTTSGVNTGLVVFKVDGSPVVPTISGSNVNGWTFNFTATGLSYEWHKASITVPDQAGNTAAWYIEFATTPVPAISANQTVPAGTSTVVGNSTIGVSANVTTTTGSPTVTVANYTGNPAGPATFSALGKYVDVHLDDASGVSEVEIRVYYTDTDVAAAGLNESLLKLYWWNGTSWLECSNTGVDTAANYIWAKINQTSTPNVGQLTGASFGGGGQPAGQPYPPPTSMPVGGFDVPPNYLVVFLGLAGPWIIAVAASAVAIAVVLKKARRHGDDAEA